MGAVDLFFDVKLNLERLHQICLGSLLVKSDLLNELLPIESEPERDDFEWEPHGGVYDLAVNLKGGGTLYVEVKVDAKLGETQRQKQIQEASQRTEDGPVHLLYLLMGASQVLHDSEQLQEQVQTQANDACSVHVRTGVQVRDILENCHILPDRGEELRDTRDLIGAYADALWRLERRSNHYKEKDVEDWGNLDYYGFFSEAREKGIFGDAKFGYVSNPSGGFPGCWWFFHDLPGGDSMYLQWEGDMLEFKVKVEDKDRQSEVRNKFSKKVRKAAEPREIEVDKPDRFGKGEHMTIAQVLPSGLGESLDWQDLEGKVDVCEEIVEQVCEKANESCGNN